MNPSKNLPLLLNLSYTGFNRPDFQPIKNSDGSFITFCNQFIQFVCAGMNYFELAGFTANEMVHFMNDSRNGWITVSEEVGQSHANSGVIVLAGWINPIGHGHICLVLPGILEKSKAFNKAVPKVVNIGESVFLGKKLSFAFVPEMNPKLYALAAMI